jgi:nicotinamidase-related amidase
VKKIEPSESVLLMIDMEKAFVEPGAALCIAGAMATVPACARAAAAARDSGAGVIWVKREYAEDYSDMEIPRRDDLISRGIAGVLAPGSAGLNSTEEPDGLEIMPCDEVLVKKRYSAFFGTGLAEKLRGRGIKNVLIAGTTTPNCIRTTCYDAISYDFTPVVLEACCSSQTDEIQDANIADMERAGALIFRGTDFAGIFSGR